jgi:anti-sigma regulatory factor (Ser/Thr protein kinase)
VRRFVREELARHPARDDAVVIAYELAANSVTHSYSSGPEGRFLVHVTVLGPAHAAVIVTDAGGLPIPPVPAEPDQDGDAESGRGLAVVRSLASCFGIQDHGNGLRTFTAMIHGSPAETAAREITYLVKGRVDDS